MTTRRQTRRSFTVLLLASAIIFMTVTADAAVHYVTWWGAGSKNGANWENAYDEAAFPAAILSANAGDEIWVKADAYRPSTTFDKTKSFFLKSGVALYGGFAGTETSSADKDPAAHVTVLTGEIWDDDVLVVNGVTINAIYISGINSECVVRTESGCGAMAVLDGFTITAGDNTNSGGGMSLEDSSLTVKNCAFADNRTSDKGGGVATSNSNAVFEHCRFSGNRATGDGGGMHGKDGDSTLRRCTFSENFRQFRRRDSPRRWEHSRRVRLRLHREQRRLLRRDVQRQQRPDREKLHLLREQRNRPVRRRNVQLFQYSRYDRDELHLLG